MTATSVVTNLPVVDPGTYLLALTSTTDGAGGIFYLTVGAVGPHEHRDDAVACNVVHGHGNTASA